MVEITPFKGITYNKEKIKNLDNVMSPPYDIINTDMQNNLYKKHENNFVKLILGKQSPDDSENNNKYTKANQLFETWLQNNILIESKNDAIYPYKIQYNHGKQTKTMNGFFILLKLDPEYKQIKAHERTLSKPKADRLNLMKACKANLEPIQLLYIDKDDAIRKKIDKTIAKPILQVKGYDTFTHQLFKIENEKLISDIRKNLKDKVLFIADGHHRYQTAINYAEEQKKQLKTPNKNPAFNYRMAILVNMFDEGLAILPTHRLIKKDNLSLPELLEKLHEFFIVEEKDTKTFQGTYNDIGKQIINDISTDNKHKFALYCKNKYFILTLKDEKVMDTLAKDHSKIWRTLDVSILHKIILEKIMKINENNLEDHVKYTRVDGEAVKLVDEGSFNLSFLMNATKIDELKAIADGGEHMPQKSTYFLPKMLSGLVMYKMSSKKK